MTARPIVVPLKAGCSDGDATHRPSASHTEIRPTLYLEKVATMWMQDRGDARPGVKYILEGLPQGYVLFERPRANGSLDKYLFGHPAHKFFDSPNRFYPHFKHLMENAGSNIGCPCTVCDPRGGILPGRHASTSEHFAVKGKSNESSSLKGNHHSYRNSDKAPSKPMGRPKLLGAGTDPANVDDEGTPDVYRNLINKLRRHGTLDEVIHEPFSLDWRAEQEIIPNTLRTLQRNPQWIPRVGEVLLYIRNVPEGFRIFQDTATGEYELRASEKSNNKKMAIVWEAGLVGEAPAVADDASNGDGKMWCVSQSGVRIEPIPGVNGTDKSLSKRYTYVAVEHTRPFFLWGDYIGQIKRENRHPTIQNAFTVAATMSLVGKHRFQGTWPNAQIFCHAIFIGSELIATGDTVRLAPKTVDNTHYVTDVLVVKTIRVKLSNLDHSSSNDYDGGRPYNLEIWVYGSAYTTEVSRSNKQWLGKNNEVPKAADGYGDWYPLHPPTKELAIPFSRIIGRLYEYDFLEWWVNEPDLDSGREGVLDARNFSAKNDERILSNSGTSWFWGDSRADSLDLYTINGVDVGKNDVDRDPKEWRRKVKSLSAEAGLGASDCNPTVGVRSLKGFMATETTCPLRTRLPSEGSTSGNPLMINSKRRIIETSEDGQELHKTRVVTTVPPKKHRVQVVID